MEEMEGDYLRDIVRYEVIHDVEMEDDITYEGNIGFDESEI